MVRVGTARCNVESWRRKSVTDELGRFSTRDRKRWNQDCRPSGENGQEHDFAHLLRDSLVRHLFTIFLSGKSR